MCENRTNIDLDAIRFPDFINLLSLCSFVDFTKFVVYLAFVNEAVNNYYFPCLFTVGLNGHLHPCMSIQLVNFIVSIINP